MHQKEKDRSKNNNIIIINICYIYSTYILYILFYIYLIYIIFTETRSGITMISETEVAKCFNKKLVVNIRETIRHEYYAFCCFEYIRRRGQ